MLRMSPRRQAMFWGGLGTAMLLFGFIRPWFIVNLGGFRFPLGILLVLYAGLQFILHLITRERVMTVTDEEVARYGHALELATPRILEMLSEGRSVTLVSEEVEAQHGVPPDVTHRYTIVLLNTIKREQRDLLVTPDENGENSENSEND